MSSKKRSKRSGKDLKYNRHRSRPAGFAGVRPDKRLGQNFLIDEEVIATIIEIGARTNMRRSI